jgi:DNA-binding beta-propeller fold protein YncE
LLGRGTVAVIARGPSVTRVLIFPPHSDKFAREIPIHGSHLVANSLAFDRRGHLYVGINDTSRDGRYHVVEFNLRDWVVVREIRDIPQWPHSSVAIDDQNVLYVNAKAFIGGDVKLFRRGDLKPWLEIKDHRSPLTMLVARDSLWVGYEGAFADALARYRLRSTDRTWLQTIGANLPLKLAVNPEGSLIAAKLRRNSKSTIDVTDVQSGKRAQLLDGNGVEAMASDDSGHLYIGELHGTIHRCTFHSCFHSFETNSTVLALAVSPLDGTLYVAASGKPSIQVYDPRTGSLVMYIPISGGSPSRLAIEP